MTDNAGKGAGPAEAVREIVDAEVEVINRRRRSLGRPEIAQAEADGAERPLLDVTALALSGGGIRSASFCLGVLQALNEKNCLGRIDYLSTVSGGGYIGCALSATMARTGGDFVFGASTGKRSGSDMTDVKDTPSIGHLRNYSNYLIPFGMRDLITAIAIIVRGLIANASLVLPFILFFAFVTIFSNPYRTDLLRPNVFGLIRLDFMKVTHFGVTLLVTLLAVPAFFLWALVRSRAAADNQSEFRTTAPTVFATLLVVIAAVFFMELQPFLVDGMFALADEARSAGGDSNSMLTAFIRRLAAIATPIAAVVTVFRQQFAGLLKSITTASGITKKMGGYLAQAAIWVAGAAVPLLVWVGYLYLAYWGIINNATDVARERLAAPELHATMQIKGPGIELQGKIDCDSTAGNRCEGTSPAPAAPKASDGVGRSTPPEGRHTPQWLINAAGVNYDLFRAILPTDLLTRITGIDARVYERVVMWLYLVVASGLFVITWALKPNANSLHRLYRDRLSKAFLFDPKERLGTRGSVDLGRDFKPLDTFKISELVPKDNDEHGELKPPCTPYHLVNAALNVQGSDYANRRGRNADFFLFSPLYAGSEATGYTPIGNLERCGLDLPTAMAISGAAFSSNMGANSIRALTPTLALLDVRTGYWLTNPLSFAEVIGAEGRRVTKRFESRFFLWSEISGRLYEDSPDVYITDGGHIENLGIYELLRRRCKVIIVVDAEADPAMRMPSFITLQRYARIDLGVRINMPWDEIRAQTTAWMGYGGAPAVKGADPPTRSSGPHAAIGTIDYGTEKGWLLYIKSSLSGDENDYVRDYARRYGDFPHETTGDQFFSEEQFEVYRALAFHIVSRLLSGEDQFQVHGLDQRADIKSANANVAAVREALLGP